ncbi:MAG: hypothetical protein QGH51_08585 [Planctomycetota bacterium]|jgi:hypothetical protein|nr:hypothetical protein [Planctomycetota bacterium]MDP6942064.1 hypothetical protein [Planctomycetota bacterium]
MTHIPATTAATTASIAAEVQKRAHEEEQMTQYTQAELEGGWEFKFLRSNGNIFLKPEKRAEILNQEARAGWELVEIFDGRRIRLKRPSSAKKKDQALDFDPYRTNIGMSSDPLGASLALGLLLLVAVGGVALYMASR